MLRKSDRDLLEALCFTENAMGGAGEVAPAALSEDQIQLPAPHGS